jgi:membrane fusion protein, multidrug efflux system
VSRVEYGEPGSRPPSRPPPGGRRRASVWILPVVLAGGVAFWVAHREARDGANAAAAARAAARPVPVVALPTRRGDMPVVLRGLGTVTAFNTVTVRSRVDGQLVRVAFEEGQLVREGDFLAQIDPRPFEAQLTQAEGQFARDRAQLEDARINLERYRDLLGRQFISKQQYDDQAATVGQLQGAVKFDQGAIDNAKLQLTYSKITAPIAGRVGLRLVDVGNMVHASDPSGLVVITQIHPISVVFTLPEDEVRPILAKLRNAERLPVVVYDRSGTTKIATGSLLTVDNQIDPTTGTFRLKAVFENQDHGLFPNQFVNVRLLLDVRKGASIVPSASIQHGPSGSFVYRVKPDRTVEVVPVTVGITDGGDSSVDSRLSPGDLVVVDGTDKLREGTPVAVHGASDRSGGAPPRT